MRFKDYYAILGVPPNAGADQIRTAYRKLARAWHPDVNKAADAAGRFSEINEANEVLGDPAKRAQYDRVRAGGWQPGDEFEPPPGTRPQPRWAPAGEAGGEADHEIDPEAFSEFFQAMFGGGVRAGGARGGGRRRRGGDLEHPLTVTLEEAYRGAVRSIAIEQEDGGRRTLKVRIPPGVVDGTRVRVRGEGGAGSAGAAAGDLYLVIRLAPHPRFQADGRDVHLDLPVAPWEAVLGATVRTPTLGGEVDLAVPPGSRDGARLRLRGRGLPGDPPGDQYVTVRIVVPAAADERQRRLWRDLAAAYPGFDARAAAGG